VGDREQRRDPGNEQRMTKTNDSGVTIWPRAVIVDREAIQWGSPVIIDDFVFIGRHESGVIGNYVHVASHASITGGGEFWIADFAGLSSGVRLITGSEDFLGAGLTNPTVPAEFRAVKRGSVVVCSHAILGANAVVFPGVTIGEGAAVGAGSVVTRDLEPWGVYAGAPARRVKARPREKVLGLEEALYAKYGTPMRSFRRPEER
jgi:galactoside O-acetyltransferase